ncbi:unnamed protein product, partial [Owenia fusiformis]
PYFAVKFNAIISNNLGHLLDYFIFPGRVWQLPTGNVLSPSKQPSKYQCKICLRYYTKSSSLKYHMNTHTGLKPYVCSVCNKGFPHPSNLLQHNKRYHGNTMETNN